jgi:hypothetical protein
MRTWKRLKRELSWYRLKRRFRLLLNNRELKAMFRLGELSGMKKVRIQAMRPLFMPVPLTPQNDGTFVFIDEAGKKNAQAQISTYEPPEKTTPAPIPSIRPGIRARAAYHSLQEQQSGKYMAYHTEMVQKKFTTRKLDPETTTQPIVKP